MESILTSIKKLLGIPEEVDNFDADIIMHINSVFSILTQLGVGPSEGFMITDKTKTWDDNKEEHQENSYGSGYFQRFHLFPSAGL